MYLENADWPDDLRPDHCGVVFDQVPDVVTIPGLGEVPCVQAWVAPGREDAWNQQPVLAVVLAILDQGTPVLFRLSARRAFTVWRGKDGKLCRSNPNKPLSTEPDVERLRRARRLMHQKDL
jgi:hypothetical protein